MRSVSQIENASVGNAVPGVPTGASRRIGADSENLPIEVKFSAGTPGTAFPTGKNETMEDVLMSENMKNPAVEQEPNGGIDELVVAAFGEKAAGVDPGEQKKIRRDDGGRTELGGLMAMIEKEAEEHHAIVEEHHAIVEERLRREAKVSLAIGGLCGLGVVSLLAAACTGVWVPVALGIGVCLSAAAGILVYRGMVVMLG
jgi:hypothetical protein